MFQGHWPWWIGGPALAVVAIGFWKITGRTLGVSGLYWRLTRWRSERDADALDAQIGDDDDFIAALLAATTGEMSADLIDEAAEDVIGMEAMDSAMDSAMAMPLQREVPRRLPIGTIPIFLTAIVAGAGLAALTTGQWHLRTEVAPLFHQLVGFGWAAYGVLFAGGILVGLGTSMAGGCTSGHGLSGCGNRQPGSFLTTATFFATGVVISLAMEMLL